MTCVIIRRCKPCTPHSLYSLLDIYLGSTLSSPRCMLFTASDPVDLLSFVFQVAASGDPSASRLRKLQMANIVNGREQKAGILLTTFAIAVIVIKLSLCIVEYIYIKITIDVIHNSMFDVIRSLPVNDYNTIAFHIILFYTPITHNNT